MTWMIVSQSYARGPFSYLYHMTADCRMYTVQEVFLFLRSLYVTLSCSTSILSRSRLYTVVLSIHVTRLWALSTKGFQWLTCPIWNVWALTITNDVLSSIVKDQLLLHQRIWYWGLSPGSHRYLSWISLKVHVTVSCHLCVYTCSHEPSEPRSWYFWEPWPPFCHLGVFNVSISITTSTRAYLTPS